MRFAAARARVALESTGAMIATGLPRDSTVTLAPLDTSRSKAEKCRLASAALMDFMVEIEE